MPTQAAAAIVMRVAETEAGQVHRHRASTAKLRQQRRPGGRRHPAAVDEQDRLAGAGLENVDRQRGVREPNPPFLGDHAVLGEQGALRSLERLLPRSCHPGVECSRGRVNSCFFARDRKALVVDCS